MIGTGVPAAFGEAGRFTVPGVAGPGIAVLGLELPGKLARPFLLAEARHAGAASGAKIGFPAAPELTSSRIFRFTEHRTDDP